MAVAQLDVLEPVVLVGRRAQALGEQGPRVEAQRQLAALGGEDDPLGADDVAQVEPDQALERLGAEEVLASVELEPARAVDEVDERRLAVAPASGDPARHPVAVIGLRRRRAGPRGRLAPPRSRPGPSKSCGKGSTPASRRRSSFSRRSREQMRLGALSVRLWLLGVAHHCVGEPICLAVSRAGRAQADSILVILSLRFGPRGTSTVTTSPRLWPTSALPIGDSFESLLSAGSASAEPTIWNFFESPDFWSLTWTRTPTETTSVLTWFSSTTVARLQPLLELSDPLLEQRLLVLGVVVLGVLHDVAELARLLDPLGNLAPLRGGQVLELLAELLQTLLGDQ